MKKTIILLFSLLLFSKIFAEPLTGYSGIKFGTEREKVKTELENQGWFSFYSDEENKDSYIGVSSKGLNLEGYPIQKLDVFFDYNNLFFDVRFFFNTDMSIDDFEKLLITLERKYGMEFLNRNGDAFLYETQNENIIMVSVGTQRNLLTGETQQIFVIEMFDKILQQNNYYHNIYEEQHKIDEAKRLEEQKKLEEQKRFEESKRLEEEKQKQLAEQKKLENENQENKNVEQEKPKTQYNNQNTYTYNNNKNTKKNEFKPFGFYVGYGYVKDGLKVKGTTYDLEKHDCIIELQYMLFDSFGMSLDLSLGMLTKTDNQKDSGSDFNLNYSFIFEKYVMDDLFIVGFKPAISINSTGGNLYGIDFSNTAIGFSGNIYALFGPLKLGFEAGYYYIDIFRNSYYKDDTTTSMYALKPYVLLGWRF